MEFELVAEQHQLDQLCQGIADASVVGFDTEFVSEYSYRPQLCLLQLAFGDRLGIVDPLAVEDLNPLWNQLATGNHETIVHAGREELRFFLRYSRRRPSNLFDIQIAAGLIGIEYPASYGNLASKLLRVSLPKGETRTDWRKRPLSDLQLEYALQDVTHLEPIRTAIHERLKQLGRTSWLKAEMESWQSSVERMESEEGWRRVAGMSSLSSRELAIVRELWRWRENQAEHRDCPPRRVLRDDLIVELARRRSSNVRGIGAVRGFDRGDLRRKLPELAKAVQRGMEMDRRELPSPSVKRQSVKVGATAQYLATVLSGICREQNIASSLVGTVQDVRDLVAYRLGFAENNEVPALAQGWRAEVVGQRIDDLLEGKLTVRIVDPTSDQPLRLEPWRPAE